MFRYSEVLSALLPMVAWRQHSDPAATANPMGDMIVGTSGLFYNDQHPLLTNEMLDAIADIFSDYNYPVWSALTTYPIGVVVSNGTGKYYASLQSSNLNHALAESGSTWWRETTPFNEWLRSRTAAGIILCVNEWLAAKVGSNTAMTLKARHRVLEYPGTEMSPVANAKRYVAWRIVPTPKLDVIMTIDRVALHLDNGADCTLRLYKNGTQEATIAISGNGKTGPVWAEAGIRLEPGNVYYLAWDTDEQPTRTAVNGVANMDKYYWTFNRFPGCLPYAEISAFTSAGPGEADWTEPGITLQNDTNYGLNIQFSAACDYTNLIVEQKALFAPAIAKRVALSLLREIAFNPKARINRFEGNVNKETILYEVDGNTMGRPSGLAHEYKQMLETIYFDKGTLSKECLPCKGPKVRFTTT